MQILKKEFFDRDPMIVAKELLGKILVRNYKDKIISGRIVETEAYLGLDDEAAHSFRGKTGRTAVLFEDAGLAYVHNIHMQTCLDVSVQGVGIPNSVLIRALEPLEGSDLMKKFRNKENLKDLTTGPGKLGKALNILKEHNGCDMTNSSSPLYFADDGFEVKEIVIKKRIGLNKNADPEMRFYIKNNIYVSKK